MVKLAWGQAMSSSFQEHKMKLRIFFALLAALMLSPAAIAQLPCYGTAPVTPNLGFSIPIYDYNGWNATINDNFSCLDNYLSGATAIPAIKITGAPSGSVVAADGTGYVTPLQSVASGTVTFTATTYSSGTCGTVQSLTATGALGTDRISITPNANWATISGGGFVPGVSGNPLTVVPFISSGQANFQLCNYSSSSVTTTASTTANWGVTR
jgi:hypothetical protein